MRNRKSTRGIPLPTLTHLVVIAGLGLAGWWGFRGYTRHRSRQQLFNAEVGRTERLQAIEAWVAYGPSGVDELARGLEHQTPRVRRDAARALGRIGPPAAAAVSALTRALADPAPIVRAEAATALSRIDRAASTQAVLPLLGDPDPHVRETARNSLIDLGPACIEAVIDATELDAPLLRCEAIKVLDVVGGDNERCQEIARRFTTDANDSVREVAILSLLSHGAATPAELVTWLDHENSQIANLSFATLVDDLRDHESLEAISNHIELADPAARKRIIVRLRDAKSQAEPLAPLLMNLIRRLPDHEFDFEETLLTLIEISKDPHDLVPILIELLDQDPSRSRTAAIYLNHIDQDEVRRQIPQLIARLELDDERSVQAALGALSGIAEIPETAVPALTRFVQAESAETRLLALSLVSRLGGGADALLPAITARIESRDYSTDECRALFEAVIYLGPAAATLVPRLVEIVKTPASSLNPHEIDKGDSGEQARVSALYALGHIATPTPDFIELLTAALGDNNSRLRAQALSTMAEAGVSDEKLLPRFFNAMSDPDAAVREAAARAIVSVVGQLPVVIDLLVEALKDQSAAVRQVAAKSLTLFGANAKRALPALRAAFDREKELGDSAAVMLYLAIATIEQASDEPEGESGSSEPTR